MANNIEVSVPRVTDSQLFRIFIDETLTENSRDLHLTPNAYVKITICGNLVVKINIQGEIAEEYHSFIEKIKNGNIHTTTIHSICLTAGTGQQAINYTYKRSPNSFIDTFCITYNAQVNSDVLDIYYHLHELLLKHADKRFEYHNENNLQIASVHHEVFTRLEGLSAELITKQYDQVQKLEQDKQAFLDERTKEHTDKIQALDEEYSEKRKELDEEYQQRQAELNERQQQIDDADNTTARRKTTTRMLEEVQEKAKQFNFSDNVNSRSKAAMLWAITLVVIAALVSIESTITLTTNSVSQNSLWFLYARITFSSALLISSIVYLIRWYNSWANRIAQQELDNQKFVRDLNRAHLAVEMALEWNEKKDGAIPARLLDSLTDGLFKSKDSTPPELLHPAEQIAAALVKSSEKITLPFGGGSMEVSGKRIAKQKSIKTNKPEA